MRLNLRNFATTAILTLIATLFVALPVPSTASAALIAKFQAQSPTSVFIPATQPVPMQGTTVNLSFDSSDFLGASAAINYANALSTSTTATVSKVIADYGYQSYTGFTALADNRALGYLVLLDFGTGQKFNFAYVGNFTFAQAATQIDATGVTSLYSYVDGGQNYLWAPSSLSSQVSVVTAVLSAWQFTSSNAVTATTSNVTLDCSKLTNLPNNRATTSCQALTDKVGFSLQLSSAPTGDVGPFDFIGFVGLQSTIQNGLVQSSAPLFSSPASNTNAPVNSLKYEGPEFTGLSAKSVQVGSSTTLSGKNLDEITSLTIDGQKISFSATTDFLTLLIPSGLAPGLYDVVIESPSGKLTHNTALRVREPLKPFAFTSKSSGKISEEQLLEHYYVSKVQDSELNKARCIVNSSSKEQALVDARRLCSLISGGNPSITETVVEARSTVRGKVTYARVIYGWTK